MRFLAVLILLIAAVSFVEARQAPRLLPEYWFEDDEWHLDVQYIITAEELAKYQALKTADERDRFISEFWSHRDRDQFYRRVEFAKANFADPGNPAHNGMETDRGRVYVMFGPPDRIDRHPTAFYEFWQYRTVAQPRLTFQFSVPPIDSCDGSYRLTSAPAATFESAAKRSSVRVYPSGFVTAAIPMLFSKTAGLS